MSAREEIQDDTPNIVHAVGARSPPYGPRGGRKAAATARSHA